jgi:transcriptional regulator with XRE-family HTH domain/Zn-dependent peptidase ImmA (M78 family)
MNSVDEGGDQRVSDDGLGARLRELRDKKGLGLREVAAKAEVNHGYLSQLERGEVAQPAPAILQKLSKGYGVPFPVLMDWAGYIEAGLSANHARALSYLGDEVSDQELELVRAFLKAIRSGSRATFPLARLDAELPADEIERIRNYVLALLKRADALDHIPTQINQVMSVAKLVSAGEVTLELEERRKLRQRFGDLVDSVWNRLQGVIHFRAREIWVNPEMYPLRKRFVLGHEIGHYVLPEHRELFAYLDDEKRLRPDVHDLYERQANQAAIELLAQGDRLREEADDSPLTMDVVDDLATHYAISLQATARRIVEETRQDCALAISFRVRGSGRLMPHHLYCSRSFEQRFRWKQTGAANATVAQCVVTGARAPVVEPLVLADIHGRATTIEIDAVTTPRAVLVLFRALPRTSVVREPTTSLA